jgi:hypothetical protein
MMNAGGRWHDAKLKCDAAQFQWLAKVARFDPDDRRAFYALLPFAAVYDDDRWWLAATSAPPPTQHPEQIADYDPQDADVLLFDPVKNEARIWGDAEPQLFRPDRYAETRIVIYTGVREFLQAWAEARASHCVRASSMSPTEREALHEPKDGFMPGALVVGAISRIRWRGMPRKVVAPDKDTARTIQRLIDRDEHRPRVSAPTGNDGDDAA